MNTLKTTVKQWHTVLINDDTFTLGFPFSVLVEAEKKTGLSLKSLGDWLNIPYEKLPVILDCGFRKFKPELPEDFVTSFLDAMSPEQVHDLYVELWQMNFPETLNRLGEARSKTKGDTSPNV